MYLLKKDFVVTYLCILYFVIVITFSIIDLSNSPLLELALGSTRIPLLIIIYYFSSKKKNKLFTLALLLFYIGYILFLEKGSLRTLMATWTIVFYKLILFLLVYKSVKNKNWVALSLASIPFLFTFFYFVILISEFLNEDIYPWILNGLLTSFIGGIALYNFIFEDEKRNFWLLITTILFVIQIGVYFINKYYVFDEILRTLIIILFGVSNFTFYKFLILDEEKENVLSVE
jgi:hypothetical protein